MKEFFTTFGKLPQSNKSMVYLTWIYFVGVIISTTFVNIYIFQLQQSYISVLIFNFILFFTGSIGFVGMGVLFSRLQRNVTQMYYIGYVLFILGFLVLFTFPYNIIAGYVFGLLYGFASGIYWNAVHSQELKNITDVSRDFYSSSISAGGNIISVIVPLLISGVFLLGDLMQFDAYSALFITLPILYSISFIVIKNIPEYTAKPVEWKDIYACLNMKKQTFGNLYLLCSGAKHGLAKVSIAIASILLLKNEINIGVLQGVLAFLSSYVVIHFGLKRNPGNRFKFFVFICVALAFLYFALAGVFNVYMFLFFSLLYLFLFSMYRVSAHTYDLAIMDGNKSGKHDFYPMMLGREILLVVSRLSSIVLILIFLIFTNMSDEVALRFSFALVGLFLLGEIVCIYFWEKYEKSS